MLGAVFNGDAKELAELIRQDPGFDVNVDQNDDGNTLLHFACLGSKRSAVIPLLLAYPGIDVNLKDGNGRTPFYLACYYGCISCIREMLKDSRVNLNEPTVDGYTPLWCTAFNGHLDIIRWWIASGREMDLGKPGDIYKTDAMGAAKNRDRTEVVTLLERFQSNPTETEHDVRVELGLLDEVAAEVFALVVFVSDAPSPAARFFSIAAQLPLEPQMVLCYRLVGSTKEIIPGTERELAFQELARRL